MFALEAQLADLRPAERVDFGVSLESTDKINPLMCPVVQDDGYNTLTFSMQHFQH